VARKGQKITKVHQEGLGQDTSIPGYLASGRARIPGYLVLTGRMGLGQDTWIPRYQDEPGYLNTWTPGF